jgi:hypothetical protein
MATRVDAKNKDLTPRFTAALEALVAEIREDRTILAALLCGSLAHDAVWEKSDIDLALVTVDERVPAASHVALYADGLNVHAFLLTRAELRRTIEGATRNSFSHSLLAKGRLLYTHDPSIARMCASLADLGARDRERQLLRAATGTLPAVDKARKWLVTRGDLDYSALWILHAANGLARMEVIGRGLLADREVLPQALALNPAFFKIVYTDLLNTPKTRERVEAALDAVDRYIADRSSTVFAPIVAFLREAGDARSAGELELHFSRTADIEGVTTACEYLADRGIIAKVSAPVRLTKRSNVQVQELAFLYLGDPDHGA